MKDNECLLLHREEERKKRVGRKGWGRAGGNVDVDSGKTSLFRGTLAGWGEGSRC